ncbi:2-dehydropantoate 2-reductase [Chloroflexales bacterium ZM16-3]|nr:2-dehydropantoate 2-reductase [Chloroflexales bacterium ZM16-3]
MRIAVVGVGGVGGYFGGRLAMAGHEVYFIARGAHLEAIRTGGLRVDSIAGDFVVAPALATDDPAGVGPVDAVIVGVKSWQLPEAARAMRPLIDPQTTVLPLLNGVEAADQITAELGPGHALGGLCRIIAFIAGPGHIRHTGIEPLIELGELDGAQSQRVEALRDALAESGVRATIAPDISVALWEKFMLIATWGGIGSITRAPIGVWRSMPGTRAMAEQSLREVLALAHARGVHVDESRVAAIMAFTDEAPAAGTTSIQRDILEGRPSELDSQSGAVVRLAGESGVPTPLHSFIYASLLAQVAAQDA